MTCGTLHIPIILPGLNKTIALKHPSSVLSIFISRIFATSSVRTRSNMVPTPAWWALLLCTWRPVASSIPSLTTIDRCEKPAIRSSFQPKERINAIQQEVSPSAYNFKHHSQIKAIQRELSPFAHHFKQCICLSYNWLSHWPWPLYNVDDLPARSRMTWSSKGNSVKWGMRLAHSTNVNSCLSAAWQIFVTASFCKVCALIWKHWS